MCNNAYKQLTPTMSRFSAFFYITCLTRLWIYWTSMDKYVHVHVHYVHVHVCTPSGIPLQEHEIDCFSIL
jgi:hypothetical protein